MSNIGVFEWEMSVFCRFLSLSLLIYPYIVGGVQSILVAMWIEEGEQPRIGVRESLERNSFVPLRRLLVDYR